MKQKLVFWTFIFLIYSLGASAQIEPVQLPRPLLSLKIVPSALANFTIGSAQMGVECRVYKRFTLSHEFGVIVDKKPYLWRRGFRNLTEARYYYKKYDPDGANMFFGLQIRSWKFKAVDEGNFCRQNCLFTQNMQFIIDQTGTGTSISWGGKNYVYKDKLFFELGMALGTITKNNETNLPADAETSEREFGMIDFFGSRRRWDTYQAYSLNFHFNFRIGYELK